MHVSDAACDRAEVHEALLEEDDGLAGFDEVRGLGLAPHLDAVAVEAGPAVDGQLAERGGLRRVHVPFICFVPFDADEAEDVREAARRIVDDEVQGNRWWMAFYEPPARIHTQSNLLTEGKAAGGTRNKRQRLYLDWLRNLHTEKEAELRGTAEWRDGDWGSPYSQYWPSGANATATSVNLEHIVCSEWLRNGEIVRESGYSRQDATICTLANQSENSERRDRLLGEGAT